jgi:osmoprotectant transport system substrate-binding protein
MTIKKLFLVPALSLALLGLAACGGGSKGDPLGAGGGDSSTVVVGSADFTESTLLAEIYAGALEAKGVKVEKTLNIGSREAYIPALKDGSIDLIPEYTGVLLHYFKPDATASEAKDVYSELEKSLPAGLSVLDMSEAEDKDAVAVTKKTAQKYSLTSLKDLAEVSGDLTLGAPPEWKDRHIGVAGLHDVYGIDFASFRALDAGGPLTVQALKNGQVDAGNLFTTDPNIAANDFVVLKDPQALFAAENVVPLINKDKADAKVTDTLNSVSAAMDTDKLASLLKRVVIDKEDAEDVAAGFLEDSGLD